MSGIAGGFGSGAGSTLEGLDVQLSFAAFPAMRHQASAKRALDQGGGTTTLTEPAWGPIGGRHVQLVPQNQGQLTSESAQELKSQYPKTQFRLHANVRVQERFRIIDVSQFHEHPDWVHDAASVSRALGAPAYSGHSGPRQQCSFTNLLDNARRAAEIFESPVAIEGQYPQENGQGDSNWIASWAEYRALFESGVPYALDLSHLNILVHRSGEREDGLVAEMLACERCLEVHVSSNDGTGDQHQICPLGARRLWWWPLLAHIHGRAVVFTEGNHLRKIGHRRDTRDQTHA